MTKATPLLIAAVLAGCAAMDRPAQSKFEPTREPDGVRSFMFRVQESVFWRDDDPAGRAEHIRWLELYLAENNYCGRGYTITNRDIIIVKTFAGDQKTVHYTGRCTA